MKTEPEWFKDNLSIEDVVNVCITPNITRESKLSLIRGYTEQQVRKHLNKASEQMNPKRKKEYMFDQLQHDAITGTEIKLS